MTGSAYKNLIAEYIFRVHGQRGIKVYSEVAIGKSCIGKSRRIDLFVYCSQTNSAFSIECKYQSSQGTADEKIPYALTDMAALQMGGCVVYGGTGWSKGVLHLLESSEHAAACNPDPTSIRATKDTRELDHLLAMHFGWWDLVVGTKKPLSF